MISRFWLMLMGLALAKASEEGTKNESKVQVLTDADFEEKTSDGFWLAEFYAPWCGHCKRLNPILDEISEEALVEHSMNIAKVDATVHKKISESMKVKGFPSIKFRSSGEMEWVNYEGGRKAKDLLKFAERIASPALTTLATKDDLEKFYERTKGGVGVGFIMGGPSQLWTPVAQAMQAVAYFATLAPETTPESLGLSLEGSVEPFIAVVEKGESPRLFSGLEATDLVDLGDKTPLIKEWIKGANAPLVNELGPHNFRKLGKLPGKLLVVGIVDPEATETPAFLRGLQTIARGIHATTEVEETYDGIKDRYLFGHLDGVQWKDFVRQFNIYGGLPRVVVLDMPAEKFYEDSEVNEADEIDTFLKEVFVGKIPAQREGFKGSFGRLWRRMEAMGWYSLLLVVPLVLLVLACLISNEPKAAKKKD
eukprot:CAMPEP_0185756766 /NCGR_PEP_ID=MMETSP1174-20130828/15176_1 /TAXON_ID=35687 /ORGANISM="Dictyocha speculum, Strain CCMP1381" /LENGTH=422 /DNA_ID=CAMNT_0028435875 /DNA_START=12 /DNA_END=1280 /DNA_ORIENTATION=+